MKTGKTGREAPRSPLGTAPTVFTPIEGGFTLIEIIIGIAVMLIALLGLSVSMVTAYRVERIATEKRIALAWATSQMEVIRSLSYTEMAATPNALPVPGYLIRSSWSSTVKAAVGLTKDPDGDGDVDYFERYFYLPGTAASATGDTPTTALSADVTLADPALAGLVAQPIETTHLKFPTLPAGVLGIVTVADASAAQSGVGDGAGYFVTVRVLWQGILGSSEMKLSTFVGK